MTIDEIKKAIREIEISYDYNHSKNDYDIVLNLTELANLIKTLQGKAIDDFVNEINESNQGHWRPTRYEHGEVVSETMSYDIGTIRLIAKQLKVGGENEQR